MMTNGLAVDTMLRQITSPSGQTGKWRQCAFICLYETYVHDILKTNEQILLQIGKSGHGAIYNDQL